MALCAKVVGGVNRWKWSSSINNHLISVVIDKLLAQDWDEAPPDVPVRTPLYTYLFDLTLSGSLRPDHRT